MRLGVEELGLAGLGRWVQEVVQESWPGRTLQGAPHGSVGAQPRRGAFQAESHLEGLNRGGDIGRPHGVRWKDLGSKTWLNSLLYF